MQRKWYQILSKEGFDDIEDLKFGDKLKKKDSGYFQKYYTPLSFHFKQEYYQRASSFLLDHIFDGPMEYRIWEMHTEGESIRKISRGLMLTQGQVRTTISRLKSIMLRGRELA